MLWKVRFENGDLRKPPSQAEFSKGMWFLWRLSVNLLKNHILFGNRLWKVQIWKWCIEKTTPTSRNLKKNMYIKGSWRDYAHKIFKPRSTQKPHSLWKSINLHNLFSGALRKPPSRAEFSKRTWFLGILSLNILKNHILFGNGLWKARFENGALRKPPSRAEISKRICI